jgi:DNA-binding transcriptional ArsR family regulator
MDEMRDEPAQEQVVSDLETVRVMADPLRQQLLDMLRGEPLTVTHLAQRLGVKRTQLYHHLNLMVKHGLVRVVRTRLVSGITEKWYRAAALSFIVDRALFATGAGDVDSANHAIHKVLDVSKAEIDTSERRGMLTTASEEPAHGGLFLQWQLARLRPEDVERFHKRYAELLEQFITTGQTSGNAGGAMYRLLVALYPTAHPSIDPALSAETRETE